ncbi:cytochrome C biogenesis protein transmembrane region [Capnocytophaga sp. oral taxon 863 str. F0517]|uniref:protein-disulfide reductase DsbD family protein n=1 Tax=Capnocytophaga sp. oral taxon 863 TaxID=1227265 RepID=UPI000397D315|nr:cytochrome c biogenesis protein CcdA [Capnocytophaga sp. oral taxon 863]ERI62273.1 cytochrome C biogenesis protein transmembrane region [Capnocytophaga sp. oral taxon 863 str. F0517]
MNRNILTFFIALWAMVFATAQINFQPSFGAGAQQEENPVVWTFSQQKLSEGEYLLTFQGKIAPKWHVYSQNNPKGGALPMVITYTTEGIELVGDSQEEGLQKAFNDIFGVDELFFENNIRITQKVKLTDPKVTHIKGNIFCQACIDVCINLKEDFVFSLDGSVAQVEQKQVDARSEDMAKSLEIPLKNKELIGKPEKESGWMVFVLGFLGGFIALLTPCVFPMIPLTVSFFTKQSKNRKKGIFNAFLYGFFILLIYVLLSIPFHFLDNIDPEILNTISTNVWLNVAFFVIFVVFAFSFFGFYEITLPSSWGNKMDNASNVGGIIGIFFMALTLAIVSFSCTGPILGSLLAGSLSSGGATQLSLGMAGFGLSLALPFVLFALFPSWLNSLPKSGGWMTTAKVFLGFLELAFALKFLSNADLVEHWGLLKREVFVGLWLLLFVLLTLYLFGFIRFPHDEPRKPLKQYSKGRLLIGVLSAAFSVYLFLGLVGQNSLRLLSGFPPPESYAFFAKEHKSEQIIFKDYHEGMAYAKAHRMPVLLDFTGWACVNCRKMEEHVWTDPEVKKLMQQYVLISLYVDDKEELPKEKQFDFKHHNGRVEYIKTIGDKWATFQEVNFSSASQPYYVLLSPDTELLSTPVQYVDVETYKEWLRKGVSK